MAITELIKVESKRLTALPAWLDIFAQLRKVYLMNVQKVSIVHLELLKLLPVQKEPTQM